MPITYAASVKNSRMTALRDACADGTFEITTSAGVVLAAVGLAAAGGSVTTGVWTLAFDPGAATATATGIAALARIKSAGGTIMVDGLTVTNTAGAGDVKLDNTSIATGQAVTLTSFTITHAA